MGQCLCDELIEFWGKGGSVRGSQWDLVSPSQGGAGEDRACDLEEQHFDVSPVMREQYPGTGNPRYSSSSKIEQNHGGTSFARAERHKVFSFLDVLHVDIRKIYPNWQVPQLAGAPIGRCPNWKGLGVQHPAMLINRPLMIGSPLQLTQEIQ